MKSISATLAAQGAEAAFNSKPLSGVMYTGESGDFPLWNDSALKDGPQHARVPVAPGDAEVELELNFASSAAGRIRVEIQNAAGEALPGFTLDDCDEIVGDQINRVVSWRGSSELRTLVGQTVRLRFELKAAHLYSLRFR